MATVLVLQHEAIEGPGCIADALHARGLATEVTRVYAGEPVAVTCEPHAALLVMGGPMGVYEADRYPHLRDALRLIEDALRRQRPVLGICLGSQLLAAALGARVYPSGFKEIGWHRVELSEAAYGDRLFAGVPRSFSALQWHGDVFDLPAGAVCLAASELTRRQAFRYGDSAYGLLFHLEASAAQVEAMAGAFADELAIAGIAPAALLDDLAARVAAAGAVGRQIFDRFATLAG